MDMYQKRKMRQKKKKDDSPKSFSSVGINWLITICLSPLTNPYK